MQEDKKVAAADFGRTDLKKRSCKEVRKSHGMEAYSHIKGGETLITSRRFLLLGISA